jgi:hypothetical protein
MEGRADQTYLVPFTHSQYEFIFSGAYVTVLSWVLGRRLSKQCPIIIAHLLHVALRCTKAPDASQTTTTQSTAGSFFLRLAPKRSIDQVSPH